MLCSRFALLPALAGLALCPVVADAQQPPPTSSASTPTSAAPPPPSQTVAAPTAPPAAPPTAQPAHPYPYPYGQPYPYPYPYYPYPYPYPQPYARPMGPTRIPYEEGQPAPAGYRLTTESQKGLIIGGAVTLGATWAVTLLAASLADAVRNADRSPGEPRDNGATPLMIPVVGPFIAISTLNSEGAGTSLLILDGLAQGAGAAMLIAGISSRRKVWVRQVGSVQLQLAPVALGPRHFALGLDGHF